MTNIVIISSFVVLPATVELVISRLAKHTGSKDGTGMSRKILVVTHDQELETTLRCEIENEIRVCSKENARNEADNWLPQIIILDTAQPGKDSYKLCRTLNQLNQLEPPSLVFLSEEMNSRSLSSAYKAGVNYYILKQGEYQKLLKLTLQSIFQTQESYNSVA